MVLFTVTAVRTWNPAMLEFQAQRRSGAGGRESQQHETRLCALHAYYISLGDEHAMCPVGFGSKRPTKFVSRYQPLKMFSTTGTERDRQTLSDKELMNEETSSKHEGNFVLKF
jgi:hypothetical protein